MKVHVNDITGFSFTTICTSNCMFRRAISDKLPGCIFENFEINRVKGGEFQNF